MKSLLLVFSIVCLAFLLSSCNDSERKSSQPTHEDTAFVQDFSTKYQRMDSVKLLRAYSDRNGVIEVSTSDNLYKPHAGEFLFPGTLVPQRYYRPIADKNILNLTRYRDHFVYVDDKAVLSNAWAGNLYVRHSLPRASLVAGGKDFDFLISDGKALQYLKDSTIAWEGQHPQNVLDILFDNKNNRFLLLSSGGIHSFNPDSKQLTSEYSGSALTSFALSSSNEIVVGTDNGYITLKEDLKSASEPRRNLPWTELTTVQDIRGNLWFGSTRGAFMLRDDGKFNYYASKRWMPSDSVIDI